MFRHNTESIRESSRKMFVSEEEKNKWNGKSEAVHEHDHMYYTKSEVDDLIDKSTVTLSGKSVNYQTEKGLIKITEILGNLEQSTTDLKKIVSVGERCHDGKYKVTVKVTNNKKNLYDHEYYTSKIKNVSGVTILDNGFKFDSSVSISVMDNIIQDITTFSVTDYNFKSNTSYIIKAKMTHEGDLTVRLKVIYTDNTEIILSSTSGVQHCITDANKTIKCVTYHWNTQKNSGKSTIEDIIICEKSLGTSVSNLPNETNKVDIYLPVPLEMVHNKFRDRLFKDTDGVWKIEKHVHTVNIPTENWYVPPEAVQSEESILFNSYQDQISIRRDVGKYISDQYIDKGDLWNVGDKEGLFLHINRSLQFRLKRSEFPDVPALQRFIKNTKPILKYVINEPTIIHLDEPIPEYIESFDGDVSVYIAGSGVYQSNIGGGISCELPVSKKSVIKSLNEQTSNHRERLQKLEDLSMTSNIELNVNDNNVVQIDTKTGYIDDIIMEGKTLKNLVPTDPNMWVLSGAEVLPNGTLCIYHGDNVNTFFICTSLENTQVRPDKSYKLVIDVLDNASNQYLGVSTHSTTDENGELLLRFSPFIFDGYDPKRLCKRPGRYVFNLKTHKSFTNNNYNKGLYFCIWNQTGSGDIQNKNRIKFRVGLFEDNEDFNPITVPLNNKSELISVNELSNNMEILSRKADTNLFGDLTTMESSKFYYSYNISLKINNNHTDVELLEIKPKYIKIKSKRTTFGYGWFIRVKPNTKYTFKGDLELLEKTIEEGENIARYAVRLLTERKEWDLGPNYINEYNNEYAITKEFHLHKTGLDEGITFTTPKDVTCAFVGITSPYNWANNGNQTPGEMTIGVRNLRLIEDEYIDNITGEEFLECFSSKVEDLDGNPILLRGLPNGVRDKVFKKNGKYYYTKNINSFIIDGSEDWLLEGGDYSSPNVLVMKLNMSSTNKTTDVKNGREVFADAFLTRVYNRNAESIYAYESNTHLIIGILKSRLETPDVEGAKKWLTANPITVIYETTNPITVPIKNIAIPTHQGKTDFYIESGNVAPLFRSKISAHIGATVSSLVDTVRYVEEEVDIINNASLLSSTLIFDNKYKINNLINSTNLK